MLDTDGRTHGIGLKIYFKRQIKDFRQTERQSATHVEEDVSCGLPQAAGQSV
jgi:hypothetical protein